MRSICHTKNEILEDLDDHNMDRSTKSTSAARLDDPQEGTTDYQLSERFTWTSIQPTGLYG